MTTPNWFDEPNGRRRFLTLIGTVAVTAAAGCVGDGPEDSGGTDDTDESDGGGSTDVTEGSEGGDGTDTDENEAVGSCDDVRGTLIPFDPGDRQFPLLFEYPDTFEEYNGRLNESESGIGAQFGHVEWAESASYPVNLMIQQLKGAIADEEVAENWVTGFDSGELLDWTFTFDGEDIEVFDHYPTEDSSTWRFLVPAHESEGVRGVVVQFQDVRSEYACIDELTVLAQDLIESLTVNPAWTPQDSTERE